jgi:hypothetical protein
MCCSSFAACDNPSAWARSGASTIGSEKVVYLHPLATSLPCTTIVQRPNRPAGVVILTDRDGHSIVIDLILLDVFQRTTACGRRGLPWPLSRAVQDR